MGIGHEFEYQHKGADVSCQGRASARSGHRACGGPLTDDSSTVPWGWGARRDGAAYAAPSWLDPLLSQKA